MIDEQMLFVLVEDVLYVSSAGSNLFSPGLARLPDDVGL